MDLMTAIADRRAVREYTETPVERKAIAALIDTAVLAPSARNLQPWAFAALLGRERIEHYGQRIREWLLAGDTSSLGTLLDMLKAPKYFIFHHAPALVLILATNDTHQAAEDCCLAAQNLMLAARERNLGTCWIGLSRPWLNLAATKAELGLPAEYSVVAPIVLGHPRSWPESHGRNPPKIQWLD